jgi:hypothetical protein
MINKTVTLPVKLFISLKNVLIAFTSFFVCLVGGRFLYVEIANNSSVLLALIPVASFLLVGRIRK